MSRRQPTRTAIALAGALLVLLLGISGFAVGRSSRTSKDEARNAGLLARARSFDASFRGAYTEGDRSGFARGLAEGEALGRQRGGARGRRHGELVKAQRLLRRAARTRVHRPRHIAHRPRASGSPVERRAAHRRKPHKPHRRAHRPRTREGRERETLRGEGREGEEGVPERPERAGRGEGLG